MANQGMPYNPSPMTDKEIDGIPIITLAFVGDSVQTLYERASIAHTGCAKPGVLHKLVADKVSARAQAEAIKNILPILTTKESEIYKRARNVRPHTLPKNADQNTYRVASGLEAVIGYLYLKGQADRLQELLDIGYPPKETI